MDYLDNWTETDCQSFDDADLIKFIGKYAEDELYIYDDFVSGEDTYYFAFRKEGEIKHFELIHIYGENGYDEQSDSYYFNNMFFVEKLDKKPEDFDYMPVNRDFIDLRRYHKAS